MGFNLGFKGLNVQFIYGDVTIYYKVTV